ncbi:FKBP-type peptidyl-prolyl cis-trans isomerase [Crenothrix sp.]|uniref:FKBP-type peptidyl-prolyl cis-trans isomerase n=1 Tax=Crenothrix sp. TaxID=3100433 RepID=UPI00374D6091
MHFNKLPLNLIFGLVFLTPQAFAEKQPPAVGSFSTNNDAISYAVGASIGRNFKKEGFSINEKVFVKGMQDGLSGAKLKMSEKEFKSVLAGFQGDMRRKMAANHQEKALQNRKTADEFLAENGKKADVVSLPSGVQYKIIKAGDGAKPTDSDTVQVNYRGTLLDGKEFDASLPDKPANLKLAQLIAGWKEALRLMPVGSKWQLFIPSKFAYGERGVGVDIGPNEMLTFEVELLGIQK